MRNRVLNQFKCVVSEWTDAYLVDDVGRGKPPIVVATKLSEDAPSPLPPPQRFCTPSLESWTIKHPWPMTVVPMDRLRCCCEFQQPHRRHQWRITEGLGFEAFDSTSGTELWGNVKHTVGQTCNVHFNATYYWRCLTSFTYDFVRNRNTSRFA